MRNDRMTDPEAMTREQLEVEVKYLRKRLGLYLCREHGQRKHAFDEDCPACRKFNPRVYRGTTE